MSAPDGGWGWAVVFSSLISITIADGVAFSFGLFFPHLILEYSASATAAAWVGSLFMSVPLLAGPLCSALVDRFGSRPMCMLGGFLSASGFAASAFITWFPLTYVTFGVLSGLGLGLIYVTSVVSVSEWFDERRTLAISLSATGTGFGTFLFAPLIEFFLREFGWRGAYLLLAGHLLNMCVCGAVMWKPETSDVSTCSEPRRKESNILPDTRAYQSLLNLPTNIKVQEKTTDELLKKLIPNRAAYSVVKEASSSGGISIRSSKEKCFTKNEISQARISMTQLGFDKLTIKALSCPDVLKNSVTKVCTEKECIETETSTFLSTLMDFSLFLETHFLLFSINTVLLFTWYGVPYFYILELMKDYGYTESQASSLLSVVGASNTLGLVILGFIGDQPWLHVIKTYSVCLLGTGVATGAMPFAVPYPAALVVAASAFGLFVASNFSFTPTILLEIVAEDKFTTSYGLILLCQGIGSLVGPPVAAFVFDVFGNWELSFYLSGSWIIFAGLIMLIVPSTENLKFCQPIAAVCPASSLRTLSRTSV